MDLYPTLVIALARPPETVQRGFWDSGSVAGTSRSLEHREDVLLALELEGDAAGGRGEEGHSVGVRWHAWLAQQPSGRGKMAPELLLQAGPFLWASPVRRDD